MVLLRHIRSFSDALCDLGACSGAHYPAYTPQIVTDTYSGSANELHISPTSSALTVGNTPSAGDLCFFQMYRDADNGGDTFSADAQLIGIKIIFTTDAENDN